LPAGSSPIYSMTGFGRGEAASPDGRRFRIECRSVNHRFAEVVCRLPREYAEAEDGLRRLIASEVKRGRVEVLFSAEAGAAPDSAVRVDTALARAYHRGLKELAAALGAGDFAPEPTWVASLPGVLSAGQPAADLSSDWPVIAAAARDALSGLMAMRAAEGAALRSDLLAKLDELSAVAETIAAREPAARAEFRDRLRRRLDEWLQPGEVDPARLAQEVAILVERSAIDEELVRLHSHSAQLRAALAGGGEVGRRCDFIIQECNRELNTIGSKAQDAAIAAAVVEGKGLVEKLREQVQNLE
jgi:uncharacterized protein (TIGR00255 family)